METLPNAARSYADSHGLLPEGAPVLVMVSGGGDSVALLHLFARGVFGERPLRVLHVNHSLRGIESDADEAFVRALCRSLGIDCVVERVDISALAAARGLNLEDAGRRARAEESERALAALCSDVGESLGSGRIAVAHTRDDRVETFFMRVATGAGAGALSSIRPQRGRVVRPLLFCDRAELRAWLEREGCAWREDATNQDTTRTRAYIRNAVVPLFERLNPAFRDSLERSLDLLADDDALLSSMADAFGRDFATSTPDERVEFERDLMATLERTMRRRTVRSALLSTFPDASRIEASHIESLVDGLAEDGYARDLPGGLSAYTEYGTLVVSRSGADQFVLAPSVLEIPGTVDLGPAGSIAAEWADCEDVSGGSHSVVVDATAFGDALTVDSVREGDRMRPFGMEGTRKLSDMLIDAKVPRRDRGALPVVRDGERIVWLAGVRMSEEYRVTRDTERAVRLTWRTADRPGGFELNGASGT